jgi:hypothetical protein
MTTITINNTIIPTTSYGEIDVKRIPELRRLGIQIKNTEYGTQVAIIGDREHDLCTGVETPITRTRVTEWVANPELVIADGFDNEFYNLVVNYNDVDSICNAMNIR